MRIYVAGPMRGIPYYNFPAFDKAANQLREEGHEVVNPADLDRANGFDAMTLPADYDWSKVPHGFDFGACVTRDIKSVRECDAIYMLADWEDSSGARAEYAIAEWLGKKTMFEKLHFWGIFPAGVTIPAIQTPKAQPEVLIDKSDTVLEEAIRLTTHDRQSQYGHPRVHFARTAAALNARFRTGKDPLFARDMAPQEWPIVMAIDKLCGRGNDTTSLKRDSVVDVCGYMRTHEMCGEEQAE